MFEIALVQLSGIFLENWKGFCMIITTATTTNVFLHV